MCTDFRNVKVWENVHLRIEESVATDGDWGTEGKGGQGGRKILNREFGSYLCYEAEKSNSEGPNLYH